MNSFLILFVRLIVGIVFGVFICRLFRPEWGMYKGAFTGIALVLIVYGMEFFKKRNANN